MRPHRNTGAPFKRHDGTTWESGRVNVPTPLELKRRAYKLKPAAVFDTTEPAEADDDPAPDDDAEVEED